MRRWLLPAAVAALLVTGACSSGTKSSPAPATPTPTTVAAITRTTQTPGTSATPQGFFLEVTSPAHESTVRVSPTEVRGRTASDAVVTVNGIVQKVDGTGGFSVMVNLTEGPNSIEVIASDFRDNQASKVITVVYIK